MVDWMTYTLYNTSSNMYNTKKKRRVPVRGRVDEGGHAGASGEHIDCTVHEELKDIKSTMNEMMEHTRLQTQNMTNMMQMMKCMQGEIAHLTNKYNEIKHIIHETKDKCVDNGTSISTMNSRFDNVDKKQQYHEVLLQNQKWKYSAPRPSPEYWDDLNIDEEADAEEAEEFLTQIKVATEEMRYGTDDGKVDINAVLPYNEEFLPHWEEFANVLEQYRYRLKCLPKETVTPLCLCGMELPNEVLKLLSKALESTHFNHLVLGNNSLGQSGIDFALKYVKSNCILKGFALCGNPIEYTKDIKQICQIVEEHRSIEKLYLVRCRGADVDGHEMLKMIMTAGKIKLKVLNLSDNDINTGGDTFISDFLVGNPILEWLNLSSNQLDDNDAIAIAGALKLNSNLETLDVRNNRKMTKAGWEALHKAEFDDTSLNSAADSNHACWIRYPSGDDEIQGLNAVEINGNSDYNFPSVRVRQKKIFSVLSSRNRECSNVGHFDDVPVEFLPEMLLTFQQYSNYHVPERTPRQDTNDVNPLSIVYEVCRYWDKSLAVYELLSS